jgi:hypothetical protein
MKTHLKKKELLAIEKNVKGMTVYCLDGEIWLTQSGDLNDHLILPGKSFTVSCKGKIVLVALSFTTLTLSPVTQSNGMACKGKDLFYKITEAIPKNRWLWRSTIGQS